MVQERDVQRFMSKVSPEPNTGCWLWTGAISSRQYGQFWVAGRTVGAHRFALSVRLGHPLPDNMDACHRCDNPPCVNPDHLFPGTAQDNMADCKRKGRIAKACGELNGRTKLTDSDVMAIRSRGTGMKTHREIAKDYGVARATVTRVLLHARRTAK